MSGNEEERPNSTTEQPLQVKNLKGLLKFCLEATKSEDATGTTSFEPMSEERRKWLEEALTSMTVSPAERLNACLTLIDEAVPDTEEGTEQQIQALTELQDWLEDLDIATDFIKMNGLRIVPRLLSSEVSELRWRCLELLANISQNNPAGQAALLGLDLLPPILMLLDTDPNPTVRVKALYAVSCLVRSNVKAQRQLLSSDGLSILVNALQSGEEKLRIKATFLISSLCSSDQAFKDSFLDKGALEQLVKLLKDEDHSSTHEHMMSALLALVTENSRAQQKCLEPSLDMQTFLCQRIRFLEGKEEFQEEKDHAEQILDVLNKRVASAPTSQGNSGTVSLMLA